MSERIVRVEEALKNQNLLMEKRFEDMNRRFEDLIHLMDRRFEHISKQVAHSFGWTIGIMSGLFVTLGVLITVYRFLGTAG